jgi:copper(I)-binding protein
MQMRPVEAGFAVEPNQYLELAPGGLHIMLINLTQPLVAGTTFELLLNFEHAGDLSVTVPVREMADMEGGEGMNADMQMLPEMTPAAMPQSSTEWGEACAGMHVVGAWARPAAAGMPNSAAYGLLLNLTDSDDVLVSASTDAAEVAELHQMLMTDNDVMQMRPVEGGILVPAGGIAQLQPGGQHVMLIGLTQELVIGTTLDLTLSFAQSGDIVLSVPVQEPVEMPMGDMSEHSGG